MAQNLPIPKKSGGGGEAGDLLMTRTDLGRLATMWEVVENMLPLAQGALTRRGGTQFIHAVDGTLVSILVPFIYATLDAYVLEFTANRMRVYRNRGIILDGGVPLEVVTPWSEADLASLWFTQDHDTLFVFHGSFVTRKISRSGHTSWSVTQADFTGGPFRAPNTDEDAKIRTEAADVSAGVSIALEALADVFSFDQEGGLMRLDQPDGALYGAWETGKNLSVGDKVRHGGNVYELIEKNGNTGTSPPIHTSGAEWDGATGGAPAGGKWQYLHSGYGIVRVDDVTDARNAQVTVITTLPDAVIKIDEDNGGTTIWREGSFSRKNGYPRVGAFHDRRLWAFSTARQPKTAWGSAMLLPESHAEGDLDTDAVVYTLDGDGVNAARWVMSAATLLIGTAGGPFSLGATQARETITPTNVFAVSASEIRCAAARAVKADVPIFIAASGRSIHKVDYDFGTDKWRATDLLKFADHIGKKGIREIAWVQDPYRTLWMRLGDGSLASLTYMPEDDVIAAARHPMENARVTSMAVIPSPDGTADDLWLAMERDLERGVTETWVEVMHPPFEAGDAAPVEDAWHFDGAVRYEGAEANVISGLTMWEGETLAVMADGRTHEDVTVEGGQVTLTFKAEKVLLGKRAPYRVRPLRAMDERRGDLARVPAVVLNLKRTADISIGPVHFQDDVEPEDPREIGLMDRYDVVLPAAGGPMTAPPRLFTGEVEKDVGSSFDRRGQWEIIGDGPYPATILGATPITQVSG